MLTFPQMSDIGDRIRQAREAKGLSQEALGKLVGGVSREAVSLWETGKTRPRDERLEKIAHHLGVRFDWLRTGQEATTRGVNTLESFVPQPIEAEMSRWRKDLPVKGVASAGTDGFFWLNGETIEMTHRPPRLADVANAYALYVQNESMFPRFKPGELIWIHPGRPPHVGQDVVIEFHAPEGEAGKAIIAELVRRSASKVTVRKYNPPQDIDLPAKDIKSIHLIVGRFSDGN